MCAIVDANAANEVFWFGQGPDPRPEAGRRFFDWAFGPPGKPARASSRKRRPRLVVGGNLLTELRRTLGAERIRKIREAQLAGTIVVADPKKVEARAREVATKEAMESDDPPCTRLGTQDWSAAPVHQRPATPEGFQESSVDPSPWQGVLNIGPSPFHRSA